MGRKIKKETDVQVTRTTPSSLESILTNKTKGIFYYHNGERYVIVDNRAGRGVQLTCENLSEVERVVEDL